MWLQITPLRKHTSFIWDVRDKVLEGVLPSPETAFALSSLDPDYDEELCRAAVDIRMKGKGLTVTYSPKVFIPLTQLCRDDCSYCTFRKEPGFGTAYLPPEQVLDLAKRAEAMGCREALFTLGERPEQRYPEARRWLNERGYQSTIEYLADMCQLVLKETKLIPHSNPGTMTYNELQLLKPCNGSLGMMLESVDLNLLRENGPHFKSPSKHPRARIKTLERAGHLRIPFTTGLLIGLGDSIIDQVKGLLEIRRIHQHGRHIQEVIIQNFRAKPLTGMAKSPEPSQREVMKVVALARLILGPSMNIQVPPNLSQCTYGDYLDAGINDWGGISPVTLDYVNPEAAWPKIADLKRVTEARGFQLRARYPVYPEFIRSGLLSSWLRNRIERESEDFLIPHSIGSQWETHKGELRYE